MGLFTNWCALYRPSQGFVHPFTAPEICDGSFGSMYVQETYNLGAANYFPRDILTDGKATELAAEGFAVTPLGEGRLLQLCAELGAVAQDFATFSLCRVLAKRILGPQLCVISGEPDA